MRNEAIAAGQPSPQSAIEDAVNQVTDQIERLEEQIVFLTQRLDSVMRPEAPGGGTPGNKLAAAMPVHSQLTDRLHGHVDRIADARRRLGLILENLEV